MQGDCLEKAIRDQVQGETDSVIKYCLEAIEFYDAAKNEASVEDVAIIDQAIDYVKAVVHLLKMESRPLRRRVRKSQRQVS
jgi:hypothetical protein